VGGISEISLARHIGICVATRWWQRFDGKNHAKKKNPNKTENHFSHYPRSQVDINSYTRLKIAMSLIAEKA
jgi:hypothetical protein